jgi:hypothetical protein
MVFGEMSVSTLNKIVKPSHVLTMMILYLHHFSSLKLNNYGQLL